MDKLRIALVHDYLREYGGAERVVEALHEMWPEAPLYTAFVDWGNLGNQGNRFKGWDIRTAPEFLIPGIEGSLIPGIRALLDFFLRKFHSPLRFLAPWIWSSFDLSDYDVVISSSGWFMCRGVALPARGNRSGPLHICYIHHPPRNLYGYATGSDLQKYWPVRLYATVINFFLRHYDYKTAQHVDYFVANSLETAKRVKKFYRRESTVICPPVEITKGSALLKQGTTLKKRKYFLSVGRLTWAKRVDLAILACNKLKLPLKIVGKGKEEEYLRSIAGPTVEFVGGVDDQELDTLYRGARALIFCALDEDFGMVPVEAMAHGTPVIGLGQGGVLETVVDGTTGVLFDEPTVESLVAGLGKFGKLGKSGSDWALACRRQAEKFSKERFQKELREFVAKHTS